jgi:AcrR family transcriptional regulator
MSRILFGEKDYNSVSVKNIADALGISTGNLTYHFKRKEDIALALAEQQYESYKKLDAPNNISELYAYLMHLVDVQRKHAYYFKHYAQFSQISPRIKQIQREIYQDIFDILTASLQTLHKNGLIADDQYPNQRKLTIDTIMLLCISGYENDDVNRFDCIWNTIFPLLSSNGKIDYLRNA